MNFHFLFLLLVVIFVNNFLFLLENVLCGLNERHLINHLLGNYNPLERPVGNESDKLDVQFGITLQQIIDVDEKNQILISNLWLKFQWFDVNLRWNPEEYGGIENLRLSTERIWIPDVLMYNSADERFDSTFRTNVIVNHTGGCLYVPPGIFKSTCRIDITWFPFDDQLCELKFGSWSYDGLSVDLLRENVSADTSPYLPNGEWVLIDVPSIRTSQYYECCEGPFIDIKFIIHIKRRTLYYGFNLIIPCIILSSMTLLSFSLPPESGEKLHLGVTILLSMTVFLVQLGKILPATSDSISIIALYFGSIMVMVAVSVVMTVVVLNFHHRASETKEMGPKLRKFLLDLLPRVLGMERPGIKPPKQCLKKKKKKMNQKNPKQLTASAALFNCSNCINNNNNKKQQPQPQPQAKILTLSNNNTLPNNTMQLQSNANVNNANNIVDDILDDNSVVDDDEDDDDNITLMIMCNDNNNSSNRAVANLSPDMATDGCGDAAKNDADLLSFGYHRHCHRHCHHHHHHCCLHNNPSTDDYQMIDPDDPVAVDDDDDGEIDDDIQMEIEMDSAEDVSISLTNNTINNNNNNETKQQQQQQDDHHQRATLKHPKKLDNSNINANKEMILINRQHQKYQKHRQNLMKLINLKQRKLKLLEILNEMKFITDRLRKEDQIKDIIAEWRYGATVLDRLCLILFTLFTLLSLAICLISAPQLIV